MADEKKPDSELEEPPLVTPEASLAADDPTAVWDADSLREAGLEDVLDEYVSVEAARDAYGVVLTGTLEELDLAIDVAATQELRSARRNGA